MEGEKERQSMANIAQRRNNAACFKAIHRLMSMARTMSMFDPSSQTLVIGCSIRKYTPR